MAPYPTNPSLPSSYPPHHLIEVIVAVDDLLAFDPQSTYGAIALDYDYANAHYGGFVHQRALELACIAPGMSVLDAACGTGVATLAAAESVRPGGRVVAVDFAPEMLALASEKASRRALINIDWRLEDMTALELPPDAFDVVFCLLALFSVADMPALTARLWRVVRPGGRLIVVTKGDPYLAPLYDPFYAAAQAEAPDLQPPQPWQRTQTPDQLRAVLDAAAVPAGISQATTTARLSDPADWWRIVRGTGLCRTARLLGPAAAARVEAANLQTIADQNVTDLTSSFLYAVAHK